MLENAFDYHPPPAKEKEVSKGEQVAREILAHPVEEVFSEYADIRSKLKLEILGEPPENSHGSRGGEVESEYHLSACTSVSPRKEMVALAEQYLTVLKEKLETGYETFRTAHKELRREVNSRFLKIYDLPEDTGIIDCGSVTNAEFIPSAFFGTSHNIVLNEAGAKTSTSASARHPWEKNWLGGELSQGEKVEGLENVPDAIVLQMRETNGKFVPRKKLISQIEDHVQEIIDSPSKTDPLIGIRAIFNKAGEEIITPEDILRLANKYGKKYILPIVDNAQMGLSKERVKDLVKKGCLVYMSGHKAAEGPGTSCKGLMNNKRWQQLQAHVHEHGIPKSMSNYHTLGDFSLGLEGAKDVLPDIDNIPATLRWLVTLPGMEKYYRYPPKARTNANHFVHDLVTARVKANQNTNLAPRRTDDVPTAHASNTVAFEVKGSDGNKLKKEELKKLAWLLNHGEEKFHLGTAAEFGEVAYLRSKLGFISLNKLLKNVETTDRSEIVNQEIFVNKVIGQIFVPFTKMLAEIDNLLKKQDQWDNIIAGMKAGDGK